MSQYWPFSGFVRYGALRERVIVSLDLMNRREALNLVERVGRMVGMFKIGKPLFLAGGAEMVREIRSSGAEVFLDLKFRDRPHLMLRSALEATRLGVKMFDVHADGCLDAMARMKAEVTRLCKNEGLRRPHIVAVATLCGMGAANCDAPVHQGIDAVAKLARRAAEAGMDGVLTSPTAVARIRSACGRRLMVVASAVASRDAAPGAPTQAGADVIRAGADYLVIGSPIFRACEPAHAVQSIIEEIERGLRSPAHNPRDGLLTRLPF